MGDVGPISRGLFLISGIRGWVHEGSWAMVRVWHSPRWHSLIRLHSGWLLCYPFNVFMVRYVNTCSHKTHNKLFYFSDAMNWKSTCTHMISRWCLTASLKSCLPPLSSLTLVCTYLGNEKVLRTCTTLLWYSFIRLLTKSGDYCYLTHRVSSFNCQTVQPHKSLVP